VLTHNYIGYPPVRQMRKLVAAGELGAIRVVQVEYPLEGLTTRLVVHHSDFDSLAVTG
jgi:predicted dehydrogenase